MSQTHHAGRRERTLAGDLRQSLLDISCELLNEGGPAMLSMREVARRAGCTHQAPYHYFEDRESILAALVVQGFDELTDVLREAHDRDAAEGPSVALRASGLAYVRFALRNPGIFRLMFRPDACNPERFPGVQEASHRARLELERLNRIAHGPYARDEQATVLWAQVHGLACLFLDGPLGLKFASETLRREHLTRATDEFAGLVLGSLQATVPGARATD